MRHAGFLALSLAAAAALAQPAAAASAARLTEKAKAALQALYASHEHAQALSEQAKGILVFPEVTRAGLLVGGQTGDGVMFRDGQATAFYNLTALSVGLQAGVETHAYALFFITDDALSYLDRSDGWAVGTAPTVTMIDEGFAMGANTTTLSDDVYAIVFDQGGLMAATGLEGSKISRITPDP